MPLPRETIQERIAKLEKELAVLRSELSPAEDPLKRTQERLALALNAGGGVGIWDWDIANNRIYSDAGFAKLFQVAPQHAPRGATLAEFTEAVHPGDRPRVNELMQEVLQKGGDYAAEYRVIQGDGAERWVYSQGYCHLGNHGEPLRFPGVVFDITGRKRAEKMLEERARLAALGADVGLALAQVATLQEALHHCAQAIVRHLDAAFARVWTLNTDIRVLELQASAGLYTHLNGPHARVPVGAFKIGMIAQERLPHLTNDVVNDPRVSDQEWAKREGMVAFAGYPLIVEDRLVGVLALFSQHLLADDALRALASISSGIAIGIERKRAETALQRSEERYRFLAESMPQIVWTATPEGGLDYVSRQGTRYFQIENHLLLGAGWLSGVHPDDTEQVVARWQQSLATGEPYEIEFRLRRGMDGSWRWFLVRAHSLSTDGKVMSWVGTCTDIHEQKQGEEALKRANRELEEFAYVASHDLQEPLRMVNIYTQLLLRRLPADDPAMGQFAGFVHKGVARMEELLRDLLTFSRNLHSDDLPADTSKLSANLNDSLQEATSVLANRIQETGAIIHSQPLPLTCGETKQMAHVFQNLLSNSMKYCREAVPKIEIRAELKGDRWLISVHDNGIGFEAKYADRIFGLFKRLHKDEYPGTGLGLAICQRIVERYGGAMWAEGTPGAGSIFYFSLPPAGPS